MCRKDRFGFNRFRLISRRTEVAEMPPRYSQAAFSFSARWLVVPVLALELACCSANSIFIALEHRPYYLANNSFISPHC
jgi:hypothetical protein